jgi:hypothetical protein
MENLRSMEMSVASTITFSTNIHLESITKSMLTMVIDTLDKKIKELPNRLRETNNQLLQLLHQQMSHQLLERKQNLINQLALKRRNPRNLQKKLKRKPSQDLKLLSQKLRSRHLRRMRYLRLTKPRRSQLSHS